MSGRTGNVCLKGDGILLVASEPDLASFLVRQNFSDRKIVGVTHIFALRNACQRIDFRHKNLVGLRSIGSIRQQVPALWQVSCHGSYDKLWVGIDADKPFTHFVQIFDGFDCAVEVPNAKQSTGPSADPMPWFK